MVLILIYDSETQEDRLVSWTVTRTPGGCVLVYRNKYVYVSFRRPWQLLQIKSHHPTLRVKWRTIYYKNFDTLKLTKTQNAQKPLNGTTVLTSVHTGTQYYAENQDRVKNLVEVTDRNPDRVPSTFFTTMINLNFLFVHLPVSLLNLYWSFRHDCTSQRKENYKVEKF